MSDSIPGFSAIKETEEVQLWGAGPDNNHQRYTAKVQIKSSVTDSGNTPTTTIRGGRIMAIKDSDGFAYLYSAAATDGTQCPVGILEKHQSMLDKDGTAENKFKNILKGGLIQNYSADLLGSDKASLAVLLRTGFHTMGAIPHGSAFLLQPRGRYFKTADYTLLDADHGLAFVAITNAVNFTLPDLATVGSGYEVLLYNAVDANMVITAAANTIVYGDAGGALSTTLTFSTANKKMGGQALMRADYGTDGATLQWYALGVVGATSA